MGLKKLLFKSGPDPDKNDPKYKAQYESDVRMGQKFARLIGFDKAVYYIQRFADTHRQGFVACVIVLVTMLTAISMSRIISATQYSKKAHHETAVQTQERMLEKTVGKTRHMSPEPSTNHAAAPDAPATQP